MKWFRVALPPAIALLSWLAACGINSGTGDCPAAASIQPGAGCSDDFLQCPYNLATESPLCDGTKTILATSCTCTKGTWSCPSAVSCEGGGGAADAGADGPTE